MFDNYSFVYRASAIFVGVYEPTKQKLLKMFPENLSALAHFVRETCLFLYLCFMHSPWEHGDWVVWEVYSAYCLMYEGLWQYKQCCCQPQDARLWHYSNLKNILMHASLDQLSCIFYIIWSSGLLSTLAIIIQ